MPHENRANLPPPNYLFSEGSDYWVEHRPRQPKADIARYVESMGIPVPNRFASLADALVSGEDFIIRSEHPNEYDEMSGMLASHLISPNIIAYYANQLEEKQQITPEIPDEEIDPIAYAITNIRTLPQEKVEQLFKSRTNVFNHYCQLKGIDVARAKEDISYSYWRYEPGANSTIIADSAVPNRYHITTSIIGPHGTRRYSWDTVEDEKVIYTTNEFSTPLPHIKLIQFYESIRHLPAFDATHCPIMECHTSESGAKFLQYHRTRNFEPATFELDSIEMMQAIPATFVRGSTPPNGITVPVRVAFPYATSRFTQADMHGSAWGFNFIKHESPVRTNDAGTIAVEAGSRSLDAILYAGVTDMIIHGMGSHRGRSTVFNPGMFITVNKRELQALLGDMAGIDYVPLHIVSDGRRAYIQRVEEKA